MRERERVVKERVLNLAKEGDYGIYPPPMDAQVALNELCRHLLGSDWYCSVPASVEQVNTEIVYAIEKNYRRKK